MEPESKVNDQEQCRILEMKLQEVASAHERFYKEWWEDKTWNDYLYKTKEMNYFDLPSVNAYLSEWEDEYCYEKPKIFEKCHESLKIADKLKFAFAVCINATEKQKALWKEGIQNIYETIIRKLDYLSFMLFKDAERYLNPKTENMEYGVKDSEDNGIITLCLWANLYTSVRKQGMTKFGFKFKLPKDIVMENCAVRIMHTAFNHVLEKKVLADEEIRNDEEDDVVETKTAEEKPSDSENLTEEQIEVEHSQDEEINLIESESKDENVDLAEKFPSAEKEEHLLLPDEGEGVLPDDKDVEYEQNLDEIDFTAFDPNILPPLMEPEMHIVNPNEHFVVGGLFHFDLCVVPNLNVRKGHYTYIYREKPALRRIIYKRKIVPPRTLDGDTPYIVRAYERLRFRRELKNAIFVRLQLPKNVMYLSYPEPARFFPEKDGYSKDCIFDVKYDEDNRQISFKTNQFGIFGMLQRKYQNLPYKKWSVKGGDSVVMSLKGSVVEIDIEITDKGYKVLFLHPDDNFINSELTSIIMTADLMIQKLRNHGINIELMEDAEKFADVQKKVTSLEFKVYDCIALLCRCCSFMSVNIISSNEEILLVYSLGKDEEKKVLIRNSEVLDYAAELKKIQAKEYADEAQTYFNPEEIISEDLKFDKRRNEDLDTDKDPVDSENAKEDALLSYVDQKPIFQDLYHYIMNEAEEKLKEDILSTNPCLIQNVRNLLKYCRPIISLQKIEKEGNMRNGI